MGVDRISQGVPNPSGVSQFEEPGAQIVDATTGIEYTVQNNRQLTAGQGALQILGAQTALTTITTAQNLISQALGAGLLNFPKRTIDITGFLVFTTPVGTPTITIALLLGATTLATITTAAVAGSQTNAQLQFGFQMETTTTGASGAIEAHGNVCAQLSATLGTALAEYADQVTAPVGSLNLTIAQNLIVTIAASTTVTSAQLRIASIELVS